MAAWLQRSLLASRQGWTASKLAQWRHATAKQQLTSCYVGLAVRSSLMFVLLVTTVLGSFNSYAATEVINPELDRRQIKVARIDSENWEIGPYYGIIAIEDFDSSEWAGLRLAYHVSEYLFLEASYGVGKGDETSYEELSGGVPLLKDDDREYHSYDLSLGINVFSGEAWFFGKAMQSNFYLVLGAGRTEFGGDKWLTINAGAGYRVLLTDWLALRLDVRDHIFNRDTFTEDDRTNNIEISSGLTFFF